MPVLTDTPLLLALSLAERAAEEVGASFYYEADQKGEEDVAVFIFKYREMYGVSKITMHSLACHGTHALYHEMLSAAVHAKRAARGKIRHEPQV
jgi:hypothetical protein